MKESGVKKDRRDMRVRHNIRGGTEREGGLVKDKNQREGRGRTSG